MTTTRHILYVGPSPDPVRAAAARLDADVTAVANAEDAVAPLRNGDYRLALLHTPDAASWLPMMRSNAPQVRFVLVGHPKQATSELTLPWSITDGALQAPLEVWLGEAPPTSPEAPRRREAVSTMGVGGRRWMLVSLDSEGLLERAYGWTMYTGQPEPLAEGVGWHSMLADPAKWKNALPGSTHVQVEMGVYNQTTHRHHLCLFRCVRSQGWTIHIEDREREVAKERRLLQLEARETSLRSQNSALRASLQRTERDVRTLEARARTLERTLERQAARFHEQLTRLQGDIDRAVAPHVEPMKQELRDELRALLEAVMDHTALSFRPLLCGPENLGALIEGAWRRVHPDQPLEVAGDCHPVQVDSTLLACALEPLFEAAAAGQRTLSLEVSEHDGQATASLTFSGGPPPDLHEEALSSLQRVAERHRGALAQDAERLVLTLPCVTPASAP